MDYVNPLTLLLIFVPWIIFMLVSGALAWWGSDVLSVYRKGYIIHPTYPKRLEVPVKELWRSGKYTGTEDLPWALVKGIQLTLKGMKLFPYFIGTYSGAVMIWLVSLIVAKNL